MENNICRYCKDPVDNEAMTICACKPVHEKCRQIIKKTTVGKNLKLKCDVCQQQYADIILDDCIYCTNKNDGTCSIVCKCGSAHASCHTAFMKINKGQMCCRKCSLVYQEMKLEHNEQEIILTKQWLKGLFVALAFIVLFTAGSYVCVFLVSVEFLVLAIPFLLSLILVGLLIRSCVRDHRSLKKLNRQLLTERVSELQVVHFL